MATKRSSEEARIEDIFATFFRSRLFFVALSIAVVGLLALASWPWWINRFEIEVSTQTAEITASAEGIHEIGVVIPPSREIQILNARFDDLPPELSPLAKADADIQFFASKVLLRSITLLSGTELVAHVTPDGGVDIAVSNGGEISLALSGKVEQVDASGRRQTIANVARTTSLEMRPYTNKTMVHLIVSPGVSTITMYNQPISSLNFHRQHRLSYADPSTNESEILKGELSLLDVGTKEELRPHELVLLEGGRWFLSRFDITNGVIAIEVEGEANRISIGPPRPGGSRHLDRDLMPSVLSYLLGQNQLKLLWVAGLFLLGSLWKARQWALGWKRK